MIYAFDGSPSLDKAAYICPGTALISAAPRHFPASFVRAGNLRIRALRRFIKASLAQSGHVVSKVRRSRLA
jgi:hypothetical protein